MADATSNVYVEIRNSSTNENSESVDVSLEFADDNIPKDDLSWRFFIKYTKPQWEANKKAE